MSRYAAAHQNTSGPGDSRPTAIEIVQDMGMIGKLQGKFIVVTGVSSGIGIETARALALTGASLLLAARDVVKARAAMAEFWNPDRMELIQMDLESFTSVRYAAQQVLTRTDKVHILINNAGVMAIPDLRLAEDGNEVQLTTNHLSHFLLFQLLKPALLEASTTQFSSRVINLASSGHRVHGLNQPDNYNFEKGSYDPWIAYAQSKTANIYMASEIERRFATSGLHGVSVHPGAVPTELARYIPKDVLENMRSNKSVYNIAKSPAQGAATTVWAAIGEDWAKKGGMYLSDCSVAQQGPDDGNNLSAEYTSHTYNVEQAARLWDDSLRMVQISEL